MKNNNVGSDSVTWFVRNSNWRNAPDKGFLTPTVLNLNTAVHESLVFGAVRDYKGRACIRCVEVSHDGNRNPWQDLVFDRRGSHDFDSEGTILGHLYLSGTIINMLYIGFSKPSGVKFRAYSGLATSNNGGKSFRFVKRILNPSRLPKQFDTSTDIVACHWAELDENGDGVALVAVGNGWLKIGGKSFPRYSSYMFEISNFEFKSLICKVPQDENIYRLGRPRFVNGYEYKIAMLTGGKPDGDYRPYVFAFDNGAFKFSEQYKFPLEPGFSPLASVQIGYPELVRTRNRGNYFAFNGDDMGIEGCLMCPTGSSWI